MQPRAAVTIKLAVKYATSAAVALKLAVPGATTWRQLLLKFAVQDATHATTVAVYCQCSMQHLATVALKLAVTGVTTGRSNDKTCD